ncbi:RAG2 PHD domain containing protein [Ancylobacter sp. TS-1]|uniref:RAG2 PHD domain containing protein n=1 Tax=Ancylobacter sp. TS-1 TaxID=1850374 RepID=UPI001391238C|nr:RAG2 PHD domain containing protein [Ancylobacter sp. TS-1]
MRTLEKRLLNPQTHLPASSRGSARLVRMAVRKIAVAVHHLHFLVGQDRQGHWLAVERHGLAGGIFATREAALRYARDESQRRPGTVRLTRRTIAFRI